MEHAIARVGTGGEAEAEVEVEARVSPSMTRVDQRVDR